LMGPARDAGEEERKNGAQEGFNAKTVCKRYLVGCCPNDWFKNTKREMEPCGKIHSDQLIEEMNVHPEANRFKAQYEQECFSYLEEIVMDADRWIAREKSNVKPPGKELQISAGRHKMLVDKQEQHKQLIAEATALGDDGEIQKSKAAMAKAEDLKSEIDEIQAKYTVDTGGEAVCEACGVRYPLGDSPNEVGDRNSHFSGKMHEAYTKIRKMVDELRKKKKEGEWEKLLGTSKEGSGDKEKEKKARSRSRDKRGDRERDRDREKERNSRRKDRRSRSRSRRRR